MKLVTYRRHPADAGRLGAIVDDMVVDLERLGEATGEPLPATMLDFIDLGPDAVRVASELLAEMEGDWPLGCTQPLANVTLMAPIPRTRKNVFGIGLNYVKHIEESARSLDTSADMPEKPVVFSKPPTAIIGPDEPILHNASMTQQLDWEVELAVIIGTTATRIREEDAMAHVFGYSVMLDVSARDNRRAGQWIFSKGQDSYAPFGPCIVTADEIPNPHNLDLWLTKNGEEKQRSNTGFMYFKIHTLIADISSGMTLEPGDVIATGTPEGVGAGRDPQEWMWPGDVIEYGVEGIGMMRNPVVKIG
ncbi:FAA hydrolase family protein [Rhodosalinus halophilus]|uniref:FAA hydrolase family protein n=1 Tax=Rhodosalinus halophilus TaxID=2259333 RepID=A0A365U9C5_9RHOB|nr:fumarylacetoacetate hydrolase family protein [Rhodosalinus halophilus]RBI85642.1 FAA hydrolase family protein [Rhodosalinus halophilus]